MTRHCHAASPQAGATQPTFASSGEDGKKAGAGPLLHVGCGALSELPISRKGTLQQYAGRLHWEHALKTAIRIYDYVDEDVPVLLRMWGKRQKGYQAMGYRILPSSTPA
jgi:hypothetical protein